MKKDIHPQSYDITASCACGNQFATSSTRKNINVTICAKCHPYLSGNQRFIDTEGRIEKFNKKYNKA